MRGFVKRQSCADGAPPALKPGAEPSAPLRVLDLFSAAAGGWSLGMHRAGFETVAACELIAWRRALYSENNPKVRMYDDVRTVTAERLVRDLGYFPPIVVGSSPCQGISSANNAKGRGVEDARSALIFEAIRIIGEGRPRWLALENSADLRTKGADRVLGELEALGYACWPLVVRARDVGANHIRPRVWLVGCNTDQVVEGAIEGLRDRAVAEHAGDHVHAEGVGREGRWPRGCRTHGLGAPSTARSDAADAAEIGQSRLAWRDARRHRSGEGEHAGAVAPGPGAYSHCEGQLDGASHAEVGGRSSPGGAPVEPWSEWNGGLASHLRLDDGLSAWVAQSRIALGSPRGSAAAGLLVEAFGDAVLPQIPEAIGRAILRTEDALSAIYGRAA